MKKLKNIKLINYILILLIFLVNIALSIVFRLDVRAFYIVSISTIAVGVINLVFIAIKEALVLSYDSNKYEPIAHAGHVIVGVLCFYLVRYLNGYDKYYYLYWLGLILGIAIPITISLLIIKLKASKKNENKQPKFIVNK